ncbi:MAG: NAD(P)H-binding protein [Pseudomonadota bacterium]
MDIIVFGARGDVGSRVVSEALSRGHNVTAAVRSVDQLGSIPDAVSTLVADAGDPCQITDAMTNNNVAISALRPPSGQEHELVDLTKSVLRAARSASVRTVIVGGAASLKVPGTNGHTVLSAPGFLPDKVVPIARACQAQYELCSTFKHAQWSYLCPPAMLQPGERTGHYRVGTDTLIVDLDGNSMISMEDFAVALVDETERASHLMRRFTVGY